MWQKKKRGTSTSTRTNNIDVLQFRDFVVRPALAEIGLWSIAAEKLVLGTAAQESNFRYVRQIGGPALGLYQMEPMTHDDIYENFLIYRDSLRRLVSRTSSAIGWYAKHDAGEMVWNLKYATAMCRLQYYRRPEPLPGDDVVEMAQYWKRWYNTEAGAGTVDEFCDNYARYIAAIGIG